VATEWRPPVGAWEISPHLGEVPETNSWTAARHILFHATRCNPFRNIDWIIDEASVYNRALSASEVLNIVAAGSNGKCP